MSTTPLDLTIMVSQLPNLQQIALAHNAPPEAQQVLFGQMVADNQRKEDQKVQVVEKKEGIEPLSHDSGGNKNAQQFARQQRHRPSPEAETDTPTQSSNASPWAGNIINVKI